MDQLIYEGPLRDHLFMATTLTALGVVGIAWGRRVKVPSIRDLDSFLWYRSRRFALLSTGWLLLIAGLFAFALLGLRKW